jgi:hypothetical protein
MTSATKPDPDGMNDKRAEWARAALKEFRLLAGSDSDEEALGDLLVDLRHLADRMDMPDEVRDYLFERAEEQYREETSE